jgi:phage protein D
MIKLIVDGNDITSLIINRLINLTLTDERDGNVDQLDIEISNHDLLITMPPPKAQLQLWLADNQGDLVEMGTYHVDTSEFAIRDRIITITARSADVTDSLRVRREVSYEDTTLGDILQQIASRNALESVVSAALSAIGIDHFDQTGESDLSVIQRLGDMYDAIATVKSGRVIFKEAGTGTTASGKELKPVIIELTEVEDARLKLESSSYTGVTGFWNDKFGATRNEVSVGTDINPLNLGGTFRSEKQCQSAVESRWKQLQRAQSVFSVTIPTIDPYALPDSPIEFSNDWPSEFKEQRLIISRIKRRIGNGYSTDIEAELATGSA